MANAMKYARNLIPSLDITDINEAIDTVVQTHDVEGVGGYKIGALLGLTYGLPTVARNIREVVSDAYLIYDHQKAMNDIPELGKPFVQVVKSSGFDAMIGFPFVGPVSQEAWTKAARAAGLTLWLGSEMTHPKFRRSEGGYIADKAIDEIMLRGAALNVTNFIGPATKLDSVAHFRRLLEHEVGADLRISMPGIGMQGGNIKDAVKAAGPNADVFVGRAINEAKDKRAVAKELASQLRA